MSDMSSSDSGDSESSSDDSSSSDSDYGTEDILRRLREAIAAKAKARNKQAVWTPWQRTSHKKKRAGGFRPLPRAHPDADAQTAKLYRWRYDGQPQFWLQLLNDPDCFEEGSWAGKMFRAKFRVPRSMFESLYTDTIVPCTVRGRSVTGNLACS